MSLYLDSTPAIDPRKQREAQATFIQYTKDFWELLESDFKNVESFYLSTVAACAVQFAALAPEGSYRHRSLDLEGTPGTFHI